VKIDPGVVIEESDDLDIKVTKLKNNDKKLGEIISTLRSKGKISKKDKEEKIVVEGNILIKEAIQSNIKLNKLIFSDYRKIKDLIKFIARRSTPNETEFFKVPDNDLLNYSILQTCPGSIAIFEKPKNIQPLPNRFPIDVLVDNCREPNNLGAVIRIANAIPIQRVLLPKNNVDPWNTKSIRGSSGSIFKMPTETKLSWEDVQSLTSDSDLILIADNNTSNYNPERCLMYDELPIELIENKHITVIIGGESSGISPEAMKFVKARKDWRVVKIQIDNTMNSLNVSNALAVILFELRRKLKARS
jgi:TrmH family RNA methyltransferase